MLLHSDWISYTTGEYKGADDKYGNPSPYFRKSFCVSKKVSSAKMLISALGVFKVYINGIKIGHPFLMVMIKELSASHTGRRSIKYSEKISCNIGGRIISNQGFFKAARHELGLNSESCWFVYDISVRNLDELHFKAVIVNKEFSEYYCDSAEKKEHWLSLI